MSNDNEHEGAQEFARQSRRMIAEVFRGMTSEKQQELLDASSPEEREQIQEALRENPE